MSAFSKTLIFLAAASLASCGPAPAPKDDPAATASASAVPEKDCSASALMPSSAEWKQFLAEFFPKLRTAKAARAITVVELDRLRSEYLKFESAHMKCTGEFSRLEAQSDFLRQMRQLADTNRAEIEMGTIMRNDISYTPKKNMGKPISSETIASMEKREVVVVDP